MKRKTSIMFARVAFAACACVLMVSGCARVADPNLLYARSGMVAVDGDTIAYGKERIRLLRIDAPEMPGHRCPAGRRSSCVDDDPEWAGEARRYLQDILDSHPITCRREGKDVYGRTLAECYTDDSLPTESVNNLMLTSGMAVPYRRY